jgi:1,3-beta-glucanosyltransferase GAS1
LKLIPTSGLVSISGTHVNPLADFTSYSSQIAKITPSPTLVSNYVVSNTFTPSCSTGAAFSASPTLPPVVNQNICACMVGSLDCIAKPGLEAAVVEFRYRSICGSTSENCPALHGNGSNGTYGAFSICTINDRLSWALNQLYQYSTADCYSDADAAIAHTNYYSSGGDCAEALYEAGPSGTGTISTFPTSTGSSYPEYTNIGAGVPSPVLSNGAIAGIVVGSIVIFTVFVLGCVRICCWRGKRRGCACCTRRRGIKFQEDATKDENQYHPDSRHSKSPDQPGGLRGGGSSIISDDSRGMVELQPWDERYLPPRSNSEFQSTSSRSEIPAHGLASEGSAYVSHQRHRSSTSQHSGPELVSPLAAPSPMDSVKELPAFRAHDQPEDKSLGSMKLLSPVVKVLPVPNADN